MPLPRPLGLAVLDRFISSNLKRSSFELSMRDTYCRGMVAALLRMGVVKVTEAGEFSLVGIDLLSSLSSAERRDIEQVCSWKRFTPHQQIISSVTAIPGASI
jgi:hypothetical protein